MEKSGLLNREKRKRDEKGERRGREKWLRQKKFSGLWETAWSEGIGETNTVVEIRIIITLGR